jgi:hypothetical protein
VSDLARLRAAKLGEEMATSIVTSFPLVRICDIPEIVKPEWLVDGLLPRFPEGSAGYLFAPSKGRKSMLIMDIAISVATGTSVLGTFAVKRSGTAVLFFAEDPKGETSRRAHRLARGRGIAMPDNVLLIDLPRLAIDDQEQQDRLAATLMAVPNLEFVAFDPMIRLHTRNDNKAEEIGPIHTFLRGLSRSLPGTVVLLAHHTNHEGGARGSTDYTAFGDFNLFARKKDRHTTEVHNVELRGAPPGRPFRYQIADGSTDAGPTMRLVHAWIEDDDQDRTVALEQEVIAFKAMNPTARGRDCQAHLRTLGVKFGNTEFWSTWKADR